MSNRSVSTDALETLGTIIDDTQKRDAIHLAVLPMVAVVTLKPGESIGLVPGGAAPYAKELLGIVDPFLTAPVQEGERFWMVLRPRLVTSLRHVWTHPAFGEEGTIVTAPAVDDATAKARWWITNWAATYGASYDEVILRAIEYLDDGEYWNEGARFDGEYVPDEFWVHFEAATGRDVGDERGSFFSCAC